IVVDGGSFEPVDSRVEPLAGLDDPLLGQAPLAGVGALEVADVLAPLSIKAGSLISSSSPVRLGGLLVTCGASNGGAERTQLCRHLAEPAVQGPAKTCRGGLA